MRHRLQERRKLLLPEPGHRRCAVSASLGTGGDQIDPAILHKLHRMLRYTGLCRVALIVSTVDRHHRRIDLFKFSLWVVVA